MKKRILILLLTIWSIGAMAQGTWPGITFTWQKNTLTNQPRAINGSYVFYPLSLTGQSYQQINGQVAVNGLFNASAIQMFSGYTPDAGQISMGNFLAIGAALSDRNRTIGLYSGSTKDWEFGEDASKNFFLNNGADNYLTATPGGGAIQFNHPVTLNFTTLTNGSGTWQGYGNVIQANNGLVVASPWTTFYSPVTKYAGNYHASFDTYSFTDKKYVDSLVSGYVPLSGGNMISSQTVTTVGGSVGSLLALSSGSYAGIGMAVSNFDSNGFAFFGFGFNKLRANTLIDDSFASGAMPSTSAILQLNSTTKGALLTRMTAAQRGAISPDPYNGSQGLLVYQKDGSEGFYYLNSSDTWKRIANASDLTAYLPLSGGTIAGSQVINGSSLAANALALDINKNNSSAFVPNVSSYDPNAEVIRLVNKDNTGTMATMEAYGTTGGHNVYPSVNMRAARGTLASPSATQSGDLLAQFQATGYGTTGFGTGSIPFIRAYAAENYTDTTKGLRTQLTLSPIGSTSIVAGALLDEYKNFSLQSDVTPATAIFQINQFGSSMPGRVSTTSGSGTVTGVNTQFQNHFKIGDNITINGETQTITAIASNTSMTTGNWAGTNSSKAYTTSNTIRYRLYGNGNAELGGTAPTPIKWYTQSSQSASAVYAMQNTSASGYSAIDYYDNSSTKRFSSGWANASVASGVPSVAYYDTPNGDAQEWRVSTSTKLKLTSTNFNLGSASTYDLANNRLGIGTTAPNFPITLGSGSNGFVAYNTSDQTANYERFRQYWLSNEYQMVTESGGTGTIRNLHFSAGSANSGTQLILFGVNTGQQGVVEMRRDNTAAPVILGVSSASLQSSNSNQSSIAIYPTINQTSTAGYNGLWISPYEQALGSGAKYLINAGTNTAANAGGTHTAKFTVDNTGVTTAAQYKLSALNSAPASSTATGTTGDIRITAGYIYVCTATNTWVRAALTTF